MIKFRYKRKEPTNIVGSTDKNTSSPNNSNSNNTATPNNGSSNSKKDDTKENCKPISVISLQKSNSCSNSSSMQATIPTQLVTSAPISIVNSTTQFMQHPQHCQMVMTAGSGGTLPRSTPKKMIMDPRDGHKSATLTRQSNTLQSNRKQMTSMAKVASTAELAGMGYSNTNGFGRGGTQPGNSSISSGIILSPETIAERDRCINAVIVSIRGMKRI